MYLAIGVLLLLTIENAHPINFLASFWLRRFYVAIRSTAGVFLALKKWGWWFLKLADFGKLAN